MGSDVGSDPAELLREMGAPEVARHYELMKQYGHLTLDGSLELLARYEVALESIAASTCCARRQEAALVARAALNRGG